MNAFAFATMPPEQHMGEEEDRERNTSTRSPDSTVISPIIDPMPNFMGLSSPTLPLTPINPAVNLRALAASVASSPFFNLFSKLIANQASGQSGSGTQIDMTSLNTTPPILTNFPSSPLNSPNALAQSIDYYNRLRILGMSMTSTSATQSLLSAATLAAASNQQNAVLNADKVGCTSLPTSLPAPTSSTLSSFGSLGSPSRFTSIHPALRGFLQSRKSSTGVRSPIDKKLRANRVGRRGEVRQPGRAAAGSSRSSNAKKYRCDVCDKTFSRSNTLITHKRIHTGEKPFRCEHCNRAFRQPGNLTRHRLTHTTVKPFVCPECDKAFNRASNLHTHMRTHYHGPTWPPMLCTQCGKPFVSKNEIRNHVCEPVARQE